MKKKNLWIIALVAIIGFSFAACDSNTLKNLTHQQHNWSSWRTTTAPTCTAAGEETRTCSECGSTQSRKLPEIGHNWGNWVETDFGATRTCSRCDYSLELTEVFFWGVWKSGKTVLSISEDEFYVEYENGSFRMSNLRWTAITSNDSAGFEISGKITDNNWRYEYIIPDVPDKGGTYNVSVYFLNGGIIRMLEYPADFLRL
jgi:hypothetical protein